MRWGLSAGVALLALCVSIGGYAKPLAQEQVPDGLKSWIPWVMSDVEKNACPFLYNRWEDKSCVLPTRLALALDGKGGSFSYAVTLYDLPDKKPQAVRLPGSGQHWPQNVKIDGKPVVLLSSGEHPAVLLAQGKYLITGDFRWDALPGSVDVPDALALINLKVNGAEVVNPDMDGSRLLIAAETKPVETVQENRLETKIFRKVEDGIPLMLETDIDLEVAGKQREENFGSVLPEGFIPISVSGDLPVRLERSGAMRAQLSPGSWHVTVVARAQKEGAQKEGESFKLPAAGALLPKQEIWAFEADSKLRLAQVEGVPLIDPSQTDAPQAWRALPSYLMKEGSVFTLVEKKRGVAEESPDRLNLSREIWLDFSGLGYTFKDMINGTIRKSSRLEAADGVVLGDASVNGRSQYITTVGDGEHKSNPGIEVREGPINLAAGSRIESPSSQFPATGWKNEFDHVSAQLYLPPGWELFAYSGVDHASPSWVGRWSLLDLFLVMVAVISVHKLLGIRVAALGLVSLALMQHMLPGFTQLVLLTLVVMAILRYVPQGRLHTVVSWWKRLICLGLICLIVPFIVQHLRAAIYPQLGASWLDRADYNNIALSGAASGEDMVEAKSRNIMGMSTFEAAVPPPPPSMPVPMVVAPGMRAASPIMIPRKKMALMQQALPQEPAQALKDENAPAEAFPTRESYENYAPDTRIQTGFGNSSWQGNAVNLSWSGAVDPASQLTLYLLSARENLLIAFVRVIATLMFLAQLFGVSVVRLKNLWEGPVTAMPVVALMLAAYMGCANGALAEPHVKRVPPVSAGFEQSTAFPSSSMLEELKRKLTAALNEPPACAPSCALVTHMTLTAESDKLTLTEEIHVHERVLVPLPGGASSWRPAVVMVDDTPVEGMKENGDGYLAVMLPEGIHHVKMTGVLPGSRDSLGMSLPVSPHYTAFEGRGWEVQGVHENGVADNSVQLVRTARHVDAAEDAPQKTFEKTVIQPFFTVERSITLGTQWLMTTTVRRLAPEDEPAAVSVPLLPDETVTSASAQVKDGEVLANFNPDTDEVSWQSVLKPVTALHLVAAKDRPWVETWRLNVSNLWHVKLSGVPRVYPRDGGDGSGLWQWQPKPGEALAVDVTRPAGVEGDTRTIESSSLDVVPGQRSQDVTLKMTVRSSIGGQHELVLPEDAVLLQVRQGDNVLSLQLKQGVLILPLAPGINVYSVQWKQNQDFPLWLKTPEVKLGSAHSVNARISVQIPQERWILFASGPQMGPAVLFWSWIPVVIILSCLLGRIPLTPLRSIHWFLLLLGLSQMLVASNMIVIAWLLALGWRAKLADAEVKDWKFNAAQLSLVLLTCMGISTLFESIRRGLLGSPDMRIAGGNSFGNMLHWYQDITGAMFPEACVLSVSIWVYRVLMLCWALWLAFSLVSWLRWGWVNFTRGGYWRKA